MEKMAIGTTPKQLCPAGLCLALVLASLVAACAGAVPDASEAGGTSAVIDRSEYLAVDDARLFLMTRGADRRAPVLLLLHGGPGGAERPLFRYFNADLEKHFVVAYWDQRGAGRSFDAQAEPRHLTIARHVADLDAVVEHLRRGLGQDKIVLVGHSWGAALGLLYAQAHPDKVAAWVGVAPLLATQAAQQARYDFVLKQATQRQDDSALNQLAAIGWPPHQSAAQVLAMEKLADRYGGVFHRRPSQAWTLLGGIFKGLVTPWEIPRFIRANRLSLDAMNHELLTLDLTRTVTQLDVPVFFLLGRNDRHVDATLAARYFEALRAPRKRLIWFERSAHNVPFEEPDRFNAALLDALQSAGLAFAKIPVLALNSRYEGE
jgi:proline iminopeptidase